MKLVNWTDEKGYYYRSIVPDNADHSMARYGVPSGPPNLDQLDWEAIKREINASLVAHGLFTWDDVQREPNGVGPALAIFKRYLVALYREEWNRPKPTNDTQ